MTSLITVNKKYTFNVSFINVISKVFIIRKICKSLGAMRLCHPPDGSTSPKHKLLCFKPP